MNECEIKLKEGTFYFKFDKKDNLYLIFAAGLKAERGAAGSQESGLVRANPRGRHPVLKCVGKAETKGSI